MGQKTHPIGFRLGTTRDWTSHWFGVNPKDYRVQVLEDHKIRDHIQSSLGSSSGISHIQIQRNSEDLAINIHTSRPGIVIGRGCLLYTSPSPRDRTRSRMPSSA